MLRRYLILLLFVFLPQAFATAAPPDAPIAPQDMVKMLGKGFDVSWVQFKKLIQSYNAQMVRDIAKAGFRNIRLRTDRAANDSLFNIMDPVIDDCLQNGLIPIIAYGAAEAEENPDSTHRDQVVAWWRAVAEHYQNYSHRLLFDLFIELSGGLKYDYEKINRWYELITPAIRQTNPTRIILYAPVHLSDPAYLSKMVIPTSAGKYVMAEWHFYAAGPSKISAKKLWTTGTAAERKLVTDKIDLALSWQKETGVLTWVGAWMPGNYNKGNDYSVPEQVVFASFMVSELEKAGIPWAVNAAHHFYDAGTNQWIQEKLPVRDAMLDPHKVSFYETAGYGGRDTRLGVGAYDRDSLQQAGLLSGVGSLMVPDGMKVTFFGQPGFAGESRTYTQTDSCLTDSGETLHFSSLKIDTGAVTGVRMNDRQGIGLVPDLHGFPNPFNSTVQIAFTLRHSGRVRLNLYDVRGKLVKRFSFRNLPAGGHRVRWDGTDLNGAPAASGIYFAVIRTDRFRRSAKLLLVR